MSEELQIGIESRIMAFQNLFKPEFIRIWKPKHFMSLLSNKIKKDEHGKYQVLDFFTLLPPLPDTEILVDLDKPLTKGTFGTIYTTRGKDSILKFTNLKVPNTDLRYYIQSYAAIKEAFMQFIISSDPNQNIAKVVPKLLGIYSYEKGTERSIVVHMERADITIEGLWNKIIKASPTRTLSFSHIRRLYIIVVKILRLLGEAYNFNHRDLKLNNIMLKADDGQVKFIDFGMSAMTVYFEGRPYRIVNDTTYKHNSSTTQQDFGLLSAFILLQYYNGGFLDNKGNMFFNYLFTGNKARPVGTAKENSSTLIHTLIERDKILKSQRSNSPFWHSAYNIMGDLYKNDSPLTSRFSIDSISALLTEFEGIPNNS